MLISCSNYERPYPGLAIEVQKALGINGFGFDMNVACSSVPFAIRLAYNALLTQPELPGVLIVSLNFTLGISISGIETVILFSGMPQAHSGTK